MSAGRHPVLVVFLQRRDDGVADRNERVHGGNGAGHEGRGTKGAGHGAARGGHEGQWYAG